jgi:hypothetical protein
MSEPVDLLLITSNRRSYVEKAMRTLFEDPADFRVYWWDNHSVDGAADVVASLCDERLVERHLSPVNVLQGFPTLWFLDRVRSDVVGKVDDDILLPAGWTSRLAPMIRSEPSCGMLGCWHFMPEDWVEEKARKNFVEFTDFTLLRATTVPGHSFLMRTDHLRRYQCLDVAGLPLNRFQMAVDGLVSGFPIPLMFAHNMDDPRSPHCRLRDPDLPVEQMSFTMKRLGFKSVDEYGSWIAADALYRQVTPFKRQLRRLKRERSFLGRQKRRLLARLGLTRV